MYKVFHYHAEEVENILKKIFFMGLEIKIIPLEIEKFIFILYVYI